MSAITVGSIITFGRYPRSAAGAPAPIEWRVVVVDEEENKTLLISRYGLDVKPYHEKSTAVTWEECTLRRWLNGSFLDTAFSVDEKEAILTTRVDNSELQGYNGAQTNGGNETRDKVFLLSVAEAEKYFKNNDARKCAPTDYAVKQGAYTNSRNKVGWKAACWWWLRSPGYYQISAAGVSDDGSRSNDNVSSGSNAIRPAFWLNLESLIF